MGCFSRLGCLTLGILIGVVALALVLATRPVGPRYDDGVFVYDVAGAARTVPITDEAARSFAGKLNGDLTPSGLLEAATVGVPVTEAELNSRIAQEMAERPVTGPGATVDRVFIRLTNGGARAYVYSTVRGVPVVLSSDLVFDVGRGAVQVELKDPHAGRLPVGFALPAALSLLDDLAGVEATIALIIPPQVQAIRYE
ncbi:MAG: hypothetical protein AB7U18_09485, partial [Dehalococcoidia bacterium]